MKNELKNLESQRDSLRAKLQAKLRLSNFDEEFNRGSEKLRHLDGLFFRLCEKHNLKLSKFGRLL